MSMYNPNFYQRRLPKPGQYGATATQPKPPVLPQTGIVQSFAQQGAKPAGPGVPPRPNFQANAYQPQNVPGGQQWNQPGSVPKPPMAQTYGTGAIPQMQARAAASGFGSQPMFPRSGSGQPGLPGEWDMSWDWGGNSLSGLGDWAKRGLEGAGQAIGDLWNSAKDWLGGGPPPDINWQNIGSNQYQDQYGQTLQNWLKNPQQYGGSYQSGSNAALDEATRRAMQMPQQYGGNLNVNQPGLWGTAEGQIRNQMQNPQGWGGQWQAAQPELLSKLENVLMGQLSGGQGPVGLSQGEQDAMWQQQQDRIMKAQGDLKKQQADDFNARGLLNSGLLSEANNKLDEQTMRELSNVGRDVYLTNAQQARQDQAANQQFLLQAMGQAQGVAGTQLGTGERGLDRQLGDFYNQQQARQNAINQAMSLGGQQAGLEAGNVDRNYGAYRDYQNLLQNWTGMLGQFGENQRGAEERGIDRQLNEWGRSQNQQMGLLGQLGNLGQQGWANDFANQQQNIGQQQWDLNYQNQQAQQRQQMLAALMQALGNLAPDKISLFG